MEDSWHDGGKLEELYIRGNACKIFSTPKQTNSLLKWYEGDGVEIYIDRYDVRNYFEYEKLPDNLKSLTGVEEVEIEASEEEIATCKVRYIDLEEDISEKKGENSSLSDKDERNSTLDDNEGNEDFNEEKRVIALEDKEGKSKNTSSEQNNNESKSNVDSNRDDIITINGLEAPASDHLRTILHKTALFVRENKNPQVEFLIRANQGDNAELSFMHVSNKYYAYYTAVKNGDIILNEDDLQLLNIANKNKSSPPSTKDLPAYQNKDDIKHNADDDALEHISSEAPSNYYFNYLPFSYGHLGYYPWGAYQYYYAEPSDMKLKDIIHKVARFVVKNGPHFEQKVRKSQINNSDFKFLNPNDQHYPYYQHALYIEKKSFNEPGTNANTNPSPDHSTAKRPKLL